ncbi:rCG24490 [Rattus norvegicus]|uniref:RCG24490 n=1 Tax=Rattus norvegicus TaxID=10116 RepID=A6KJ86_RAT|nr:rCG24490 [Rattus norvegicus]
MATRTSGYSSRRLILTGGLQRHPRHPCPPSPQRTLKVKVAKIQRRLKIQRPLKALRKLQMQKLPHQKQRQRSSNNPGCAIQTTLLVTIYSVTTGSYVYRLPFYFINIESYGTTCLEYS